MAISDIKHYFTTATIMIELSIGSLATIYRHIYAWIYKWRQAGWIYTIYLRWADRYSV